MAIETERQLREDLYERHNLSSAGRKFIAFVLPLFEWAIEFGSELEPKTHDKVLAEIALYKSFDKEPIVKPFGLLAILLLIYDYMFVLQFEMYGILIVGMATVSGLISGLGGSRLLAAEHAGMTDEDGIPAGLLVQATHVASSTVMLVFVTIGVGVQLIATSGMIGEELVGQNVMATGPLTPVMTISFVSLVLYAYAFSQK